MSLIDYHRKMLGDSVRHEAFIEALKKVIVPGKTTVTDIGSGTGVLSFIALKLGAKHVTMVEMGDVIGLSKRIAVENKMMDRCTFIHQNSLDVRNPVKADVVISETLGNFALEEHALEILQDAKRFLSPKGVTIPGGLTQIVTPVTAEGFVQDLQSWRSAPSDLAFAAAEYMTMQNLYVRTFAAKDLLKNGSKVWDDIDFTKKESSKRSAKLSWKFDQPTSISGFCLSWEAKLTAGITLATHPWEKPTHWEQIYLPVKDVFKIQKGDELTLSIKTDTSLNIGLKIEWIVEHKRAGKVVSKQDFDMQKGFLA